jgi:hypothetical protein
MPITTINTTTKLIAPSQVEGTLPTAASNNKSLLFDGIDEYLTYGDTFLYDVNDTFSMNIWIKPNNLTARKALFSKSTLDANVYGYMLYHEGDGKLFLQARTSGGLRQHTFATSIVTADVWQMVTLTYSGTSNINGFKAYLNGVVGSTPASGTLPSSWLLNQDFYVGRRSNAFYFKGNVDEFSAWNKELSQAEVTEIYNSGLPNSLLTHSAAANLKGWSKNGDGDTYPTISDQSGNNEDATMVNMEAEDIVEDVPA